MIEQITLLLAMHVVTSYLSNTIYIYNKGHFAVLAISLDFPLEMYSNFVLPDSYYSVIGDRLSF